MSFVSLFFSNLVLITLLLVCLWMVSLYLKDASIIDFFWGPGFGIIAISTLVMTQSFSSQAILLLVLSLIWGLRLGIYLFLRNHGKPEDYRYQQMRNKYGSHFWLISLIIVFLLQGVIMLIVSLPLQAGIRSSMEGALNEFHYMGALVWTAGFLMESIGDWQLARFKKNPANQGKVMDQGLWRYTRHPNYFGDFLVWWGLYLVSIGGGSNYWTAIGPLVMSIFLMKISGVTLLESNLKKSKPGYEEYMKKTSSFFPLPPKSSVS